MRAVSPLAFGSGRVPNVHSEVEARIRPQEALGRHTLLRGPRCCLRVPKLRIAHIPALLKLRLLIGCGDWTACRALTTALLNLDYECLLPPCAAQGVYSPSPNSVLFYAVSAYFYTANGIGLLGWDEEKGLSTEQIEVAGAAFCAQNWSSVASKYADSYCFSSAYIPSMLDAYQIPRDSTESVIFARKIRGFSAGWTLGAQVFFNEAHKSTVQPDINREQRPDGQTECLSPQFLENMPTRVVLVSMGILVSFTVCRFFCRITRSTTSNYASCDDCMRRGRHFEPLK